MSHQNTHSLKQRFDRIDASVAGWMARNGVTCLRVSLGIVFLWFGALKLFPGLSPAEGLAGRTILALSLGLIEPSVSVPLLGVWECVIGLGLLSGKAMRITLVLLFLQMSGTVTPLVLFPGDMFVREPLIPTFEAQYIIKNLVLVSGAFVVGATVRGGSLRDEPVDARVRRRASRAVPRRTLGIAALRRGSVRGSRATIDSWVDSRIESWMADGAWIAGKSLITPGSPRVIPGRSAGRT